MDETEALAPAACAPFHVGTPAIAWREVPTPDDGADWATELHATCDGVRLVLFGAIGEDGTERHRR